jgi:hypothetical protein
MRLSISLAVLLLGAVPALAGPLEAERAARSWQASRLKK